MEAWGCTELVRILENLGKQVKPHWDDLNEQMEIKKDNSAHPLIDQRSHRGVSGRTQSAVCIHLTSIVSANTIIDSATTGYQILHTQSPSASWEWDLSDEERRRTIRSNRIQLGSGVSTVTQSESVSMEHVDSFFGPSERLEFSITSLSMFPAYFSLSDHIWIKKTDGSCFVHVFYFRILTWLFHVCITFQLRQRCCCWNRSLEL